jgi:hypothetical protein
MNPRQTILKMVIIATVTVGYFCMYAESEANPPRLEYVSWCMYGTPSPVDVHGEYLYIWPDAFGIFDISDSQNPVEVGRLLPYEQNGAACFAVYNHSTVYGINAAGMLTMIDVNDMSNPTVVSAQYIGMISGAYRDAILDWPYLYATVENRIESKYYLYGIDVSDPLNFTIVDSLNLSVEMGFGLEQGIKGCIVEGSYIYLTSGPGGTGASGEAKLHVIDTSHPNNLNPIYSLELDIVVNGSDKWGGSHLALAKRGNYLYITGHFRSHEPLRYDLSIVDVSSLDSPFVAAVWNGDINSVDIDISGDYAYITDYRTNGLFVVDLTDPLHPTIRSSLSLPKPSYDVKDYLVTVEGSHAYLSMWDYYAVSDIDISDPDAPLLRATIPFSHYLSDISAAGSHVYAAIWDWLQFYAIDMNLPEDPEIIMRAEVKGWGWGVDVKGDFAYLAMGAATVDPDSSGGLFIFDVTHPESPEMRGQCPSVNPEHNNHCVQVWVDTVRMLAHVVVGEPSPNIVGEPKSSATPGLCIIDVSNPDDPAHLGFCSIPAQCRGVHAQGDYAYVAAGDSVHGSPNGGLYIVSVADPAVPDIVGHWHPSLTRSTRAVFVQNTFAYVAHHDSLIVLDISNPELPSQVVAIPVESSCRDVVVQNRYAFVLTDCALRVFDVSDPHVPVEVASSRNIFTGSAHLDVEGDYVYVNASGMYTFRFSGFTEKGDVNGDGEIDILDVIRAVNSILHIGPAPSEYELWAADCNGDGSVNVLDVIGIINVILGIGSCEGSELKMIDGRW